MRTSHASRPFAQARRLSPAFLLPPAALAVHQLRYLLAYGGGAGAQLQRTGHSYLHSVVPWIVLLLALAAGCFLRSLGQAMRGQTSLPRYTTSFAGLWLACAACLIGIFACQEFLEGLIVFGHPAGLVGIFGYGGWWSIPAAFGVGLVLAAWLHGARWVLSELTRRCAERRGVTPTARLRVPRPQAAAFMPVTPLVAGWSDRGPPR